MERKTLRAVRPKKIEDSIHRRSYADDVLLELKATESSPGQYKAYCPCHDDKNKSLSIKKTFEGKLVFHCFAGCSFDNIIRNLKTKGIFLSNNDSSKSNGLPKGISYKFKDRHYVAHWAYKNEHGEIVGYTVRYESNSGDKVIIPYFIKDNDTWKAGYDKKTENLRTLYNLDKLAKSVEGDVVYVVEGEKCCDALEKLGYLAVTSPGGAAAVKKTDWWPLEDRKIIIWPDNDSAGIAYATNVFGSILEFADSDQETYTVDIKKLKLKVKEDAFDYIEQGATKEDILNLPIVEANDYSDFGAIMIKQGEIYKAVEDSEKLLIKANPYKIFQQGGRIVRIAKSKNKNIDGETNLSINIASVTADYLTNLFDKRLTFLQYVGDKLQEVDPPAKIANRYLSISGEWRLKTLSGLIFAPTIRPDGQLIERFGYDEISGIYYADTGTEFYKVDENVNKEDAAASLNRLRSLLQDFPFVAEEDESVVLAAILTSLVRKSIPTAPIFGFTAPVAGSGKSLLANIVSIISTGKQVVMTSHGASKEEEKKQLFSLLLQGKPLLLIDNIERPFGSETLNTILTAKSETYQDRVLGKSQISEVPTNVTFMATGNNLTFQGDMIRRALLCMIDPKIEAPESRSNFKIKKLEEHVLLRRKTYVRAGLNILKAYINERKPKQNISEFGSFEEWSNWIRASLVWLGCKDPCLTRKRIEADDPVKTALIKIITLWDNIYGYDEVTVAQIVADCNKAIEEKDIKSDEFQFAHAIIEATIVKNGKVDGRALGLWLRSNKGRIHNGKKIVVSPYAGKKSVQTWILEDTK